MEEQNGSEKTDSHESGAEKKGRRHLGLKWVGLKGWAETSTMKGSKETKHMSKPGQQFGYSSEATFLFEGAKP